MLYARSGDGDEDDNEVEVEDTGDEEDRVYVVELKDLNFREFGYLKIY
jgi:hypothetical protein